MPLQQTSGNVTQDAYGSGSKPIVPVYVEQVFSTYCYKGNGGTQTITNGINMNFNSVSNNWMMWTKNRGSTSNHAITDSTYDFQTYYSSNNNSSYTLDFNYPSGLSTTGYTLGNSSITNTNNQKYVSWVFGQKKYFFDVVSYSGNGTTKNIAHKLGSVPGCIIVKKAGTSNWQVYHQNLTSASYGIQLNLSNAQSSDTTLWNSTAPTSSVFTVGSSADTNASGSIYTAFIFGAGGTGGFGPNGTQDIISCGSFAQGSSVTLGWEPQWLLIKDVGNSVDWYIMDNMRGLTASGQYVPYLIPDVSSAEGNFGSTALCSINATGFNAVGFATGGPYIYIAIRRGPMAVPTIGTSVFSPNVEPNSSNPQTITTGFPVDLSINASPSGSDRGVIDRLRGGGTSTSPTESNPIVYTNLAGIEGAVSGLFFDNNTGLVDSGAYDSSGQTFWNFGRAPGFFDIVCYSGNSTSGTTIKHNLTVAPEFIFVKNRTFNGSYWPVYNKTLTGTSYLKLNTNAASSVNSVFWNNTNPTSTVFTVGNNNNINGTGYNYVAYLFATCPGVSFVGSYTGINGTQTINCNFGASGARFILGKRTDTTDDWFCWDSVNGLTSTSSPYYTWDSANAQVTGNHGTYASSGGFTLTSTSPINTNGGSYIFLAIA